jgi:hypothetical protein
MSHVEMSVSIQDRMYPTLDEHCGLAKERDRVLVLVLVHVAPSPLAL